METALSTALLDELMEEFDNKYAAVGFDMNGNLIEVMYNLADEDMANIFHAMKCRREFLRMLQERGCHVDFD
ncbi:MAG: hypothetical protein LBP88_01885 [Treponema sp.]|nr:hypothetical protein [Treponema sp.]